MSHANNIPQAVRHIALITTPKISEQDMQYENEQTGPMITEEDESEIRAVASDINERAFFGKILKTKKLIGEGGGQLLDERKFRMLSPRS